MEPQPLIIHTTLALKCLQRTVSATYIMKPFPVVCKNIIEDEQGNMHFPQSSIAGNETSRVGAGCKSKPASTYSFQGYRRGVHAIPSSTKVQCKYVSFSLKKFTDLKLRPRRTAENCGIRERWLAMDMSKRCSRCRFPVSPIHNKNKVTY